MRSVAIFSYNGKVSFGLLGDLDAMRDIDEIAEGTKHSLEDLLGAARERGAKKRRKSTAAAPSAG